uniref:Uncharacterized protein n=1 Tax=Cacopsylla melanoneura TaxID=428564 RepID=A0A8D9E8W8_9HEMI
MANSFSKGWNFSSSNNVIYCESGSVAQQHFIIIKKFPKFNNSTNFCSIFQGIFHPRTILLHYDKSVFLDSSALNWVWNYRTLVSYSPLRRKKQSWGKKEIFPFPITLIKISTFFS